MKIAALADPERREEIRSKRIPEHMEWVWVDSLSTISGIEKHRCFF